MQDLDYTFNTIRQYRTFFPRATIILSTWSTESQLSRFDSLCEVITSDFSTLASPGDSVQLQMKSSHVGINTAERRGAKYVLKTRTDQRLNDSASLETLRVMHRYFPVALGLNQAGRLLTVSLDSFLHRPYGISDMLTFGRTQDVKEFWNGDYIQERDVGANVELGAHGSWLNYNEVGYCFRFLERVGETPDFSLEHYWKMLRKRFLILDTSALGLAWPKYSALENRWSRPGRPDHLEEISFAKWLAIMSSSEDPIFFRSGN